MRPQETRQAGYRSSNNLPWPALCCLALAAVTLVAHLGHRAHVHMRHGAAPVLLTRTVVDAAPQASPAQALLILDPLATAQSIRQAAVLPSQSIEVPASAQPMAPVMSAQVAGPTFDGRPIRPVRTMTMLTTAYSPDRRSCGRWADGRTASGYSVFTNGMRMVAADTRLLPFGTLVSIAGYNDGQPVPVLDRGGAIKGHRLDLLYPTHAVARQWGAQRLEVVIWEYAD